MNSFTKRTFPISVVIATLGNDKLHITIAHLNQGDGVPEEILICIPDTDSSNVDRITSVSNVRVVKTLCRGQVAQRAIGLSQAAHTIVLQLDDDVTLRPNTLMALYEILNAKGQGNIVAPFFLIEPGGDDATRYESGWLGFLRDCHASIVCGARFGRKRMGSISSSGIGFGVPMNSGRERIIESEWLPGGVVLCHKSDLITNNYYPFPGKAYSEDLIHSILWRKKGCRLWTYLDSFAIVDVTAESFSVSSIVCRYRAHAYVAKLLGGKVWRTRLWLFFYTLYNLPKLLKKNP